MKSLLYYILLPLLLATGGCKKHKDEALPRFPPPSWEAETAGKYPGSMTAVVQLPNPLHAGYEEKDELAAFIGEECRAVGEPVEVNGVRLFYMLIHGSAPENEGIVFKYYSARDSRMYATDNPLEFEADGVYGTADQPKMLTLRVER